MSRQILQIVQIDLLPFLVAWANLISQGCQTQSDEVLCTLPEHILTQVLGCLRWVQNRLLTTQGALSPSKFNGEPKYKILSLKFDQEARFVLRWLVKSRSAYCNLFHIC